MITQQWVVRHVANMDSGELEVTGPFDGVYKWAASDYMAWRDEEMHGAGTAHTLEEAQAAAEDWWYRARFLPKGK